MTIENVHQNFDLTDETMYRWIIWTPKRDTSRLIGGLVGAALFLSMLPFFILYLLGSLFPVIAMVIAWLWLALFVFCLVVLIPTRFARNRIDRLKNVAGVYSIATMSIGVTLYILAYSKSEMCQGFTGNEGASGWVWSVFLLDNLLGVVLLDIPDVFQWHISPIRPAFTVACILTVMIRIFITIGLIELLINSFSSHLNEEEFFGTVREAVLKCDNYVSASDLKIKRVARVVEIESPDEADMADLLKLKSRLTT